jgi:hypothetical protein
MVFSWQEIAAVIIVVVAAWQLGRCLVRSLRGGCPCARPSDPPVVKIDSGCCHHGGTEDTEEKKEGD